jgi:transcription termination/antitermination protein NusG
MATQSSTSPKKKDRHATSEVKTVIADLSPHWYIVQTYVGFEDAVRKSLEQKIQNVGLQDRIQEIFIPTRTIIKLNRKGERQKKLEKVYPGYIYIHMVLDKEIGYIIQNTQHVSRIAGTGDFAVPLEGGYVDKLKAQLLKESESVSATTSVTYKLGDLVRVVDGPFKDMQGKVSGLDPQNSRISVLLTIFERETNVELDVLEVRKVI